MKVISVNNENEPYKVGYLEGYYSKGNFEDNPAPLVRVEGDVKIHLGIVVPYCEDFAKCLDNIPNNEQYEFVRRLVTGYRDIKKALDPEKIF